MQKVLVRPSAAQLARSVEMACYQHAIVVIKSRVMKEFCYRNSYTLISFRIHSLTLTSLTVCSLALIAFLFIETERYLRHFFFYFANTTSYSHNLLVAWILLRSLPARPGYRRLRRPPFWTGSEWFVVRMRWCKSWRKKPRRERVHCNWVAPTVSLGQSSL